MTVRVRFAPSPSGYLHVGGVRTALFNWLWARQQGGTFVLRVEDTDQERSSLDSVRAILDAMKWLGLDWDEGPEVGGPHGPYFQSDRRARYREVVDELLHRGMAYRCFCTKEELDAQREAALKANPKDPFRYPGTCRNRQGDATAPHVVRFKAPREGSCDFVDRVMGEVSTPNESQYDFVLMRSDGFPVYNLACVVDDHDMEITLVARAKDHLGNTPIQILIYQALGWKLPEFAHLPIILAKSGEKLSKRHASVSVQDYRDKGYTPEAVLNYLVRFGWSFGDQEIFTRAQLIELFSWDRVGRSDGKFDEAKFADVAFTHLREPALISLDDYAQRMQPFLAKRGIIDADQERLKHALAAVRLRAKTLADASEAVDYYFREPPEVDVKAQAKFLTLAAVPVLEAFIEMLTKEPVWEVQPLEEHFKQWVEARGFSMKDVAQPVRVALTGRTASPGLFDVMVVLGRATSLSRLERALASAKGGAEANTAAG
jgi:glutamyl-tRNA synthetase